MATVEHKTITREELKAELDAASRASLGIDADRFLEMYCSGDLDQHSPAILRMSVLARLLLESHTAAAA